MSGRGIQGAGSSGQGPYGINLNQIMGQTSTPQMMQAGGAPAQSTAQQVQAPPSFMFGAQGQLPGGPRLPAGQPLPAQPPVQNPPMSGISGNPGYSAATPPQLSGNYWNQVAQQLAGPTYQSKTPPLSQSLPGSNPKGTLPAYSNFPTPGAAGVQPGVGSGMQPTSIPGWYQNYGNYGL
jgi:hypothetical protein